MIELIFAIVIMAIVMLSAPMLIRSATSSGYVALQQEAIATAASSLSMTLTYHWDEANTVPNQDATILQVINGDADLNMSAATGRRAGTPNGSIRSFLTNFNGPFNASAANALGADGGDLDDIDDFNNTSIGVVISDTDNAGEGDVLDRNITIATTVTYISDNPTGSKTYKGSGSKLTFNQPFAPAKNQSQSTNIKRVDVTLTTDNSDLNKTIVLHAFSCNIGTYEPNRRVFP